ncbi:MAG: ABC-F family ATP-binding cassette domain-containing protein [Acidobacteriota bacterium]|nr:ABC-F family ATP-binding cassette domain-containing protein [Acidobacteriota bacterium]
MIQLSDAGKRFGPKMLFTGLNWLITPQDRVGLVGANGSGKSTLLKVLAGMETLDYGAISQPKQMSVGYLPQDGLSLYGRTVFDECLAVFASLHEMERELEELSHRMSEIDPAGEEYAQVAERFHRVQSEFLAQDGYNLESQVGTVLTGLGFSKQDWTRQTEEFSGGWQMRISLAKLLLAKPQMLLLDEPTNHLDLETRNWLEDYLSNYPYAYVLISHDRYFLDVTVKKIVEIWNKGVHFYSGNYDKYLREKEQRRDSLLSAYRNQHERIEQLEAFISRFRYQATKAKQVQSRIKELEKIERIAVPEEEKTIHFSFPQPKPSGRIVAEFKDVDKSYGPKDVLRNVSFTIERGERVALVGVNGAGKSTLIKLLAQSEAVTGGEYSLGHNVGVDYFAQDQYKELDTEARMLDDLTRVAPRSQTELRNLLGSFLFSEDDVFKKIGVLSGGERNRYALARMLLTPSNFLLLDEPTNHLDLRAKDVLLDALQKFTGTCVFVSHDRYFVDRLATRIFEVADGAVHIFPGNYEDYLWRKQNGAEQLQEQIQKEVAASSAKSQVSATADSASTSEGCAPGSPSASEAMGTPKRRLNPMKRKQMAERLAEVEMAVGENESAIAACEAALGNYVSAEETQRQTSLLAERRAALARLETEWAELSEELEATE